MVAEATADVIQARVDLEALQDSYTRAAIQESGDLGELLSECREAEAALAAAQAENERLRKLQQAWAVRIPDRLGSDLRAL